ncbi:hypothetical protein ACN27F_09560 [Solwaraspora sp. WMMB335]|uniref:hypothetical protein n=1 Tax=Solwaraspora sp. WMMB335 TaxID=3404118 RepID=UPI003B966C2D
MNGSITNAHTAATPTVSRYATPTERCATGQRRRSRWPEIDVVEVTLTHAILPK